MKSKAPVTVLFALLGITTGIISIVNIFRWRLWDYATMPLRGINVDMQDWIFFLLIWVAIIASLVSLIFGFINFQKDATKKALVFSGIAAISYVFLAGVLTFIRVLLMDWANYSPIKAFQIGFIGDYEFVAYVSGIFSTILYVVLLVLLFNYSNSSSSAVAPVNTFDNQVLAENTISNQNIATENVAPTTSQFSSDSQWRVQIPGQPEQVIDTLALKMWAKSGALKSNTLVQDVNSGRTYLASNIPGVFSSKSYVTALLLSFFLGGFGVDRFYLGHVGLGIGKLLTLGGCGIWALIDFILIAVRNVSDSNGQPLA